MPKGNFNAVHKTYDHFTVELFKNSILVQLAENCWIFDKNSHMIIYCVEKQTNTISQKYSDAQWLKITPKMSHSFNENNLEVAHF